MTAIEARLPASSQQRLWCAPDTSGAFSSRFVIFVTLRVTGHLDPAALQAALNDVVARHEALRTIVVRNAHPPHQDVYPPMPVPLTVRDLPAHGSRQELAEAELAEAEASSLDVTHLPLLRATLARFDSADSVLSLVSHHLACDGWSMNLVVRDLAACYAARTGERPLDLPDVPQYQDYTRWQRDQLAQPASVANLAYWREQLDDARMFTLPTDHPVPATYTAPYIRHSFVLDSELAAAVSRFLRAERFSGSMVMLAVINVLAHRISGTLDPTVTTMFHGRSDPQFKDTVGMFLNFLVMRTNLVGCRSFRDVLVRTRAASLQAYEHEVFHHQVLEAIPTLAQPLASPRNSYVVFGYWDLSFSDGGRYPIAEGASVIRKRSRLSETLPGGVTWTTGVAATGEFGGGVQYNPETFDDSTVQGWVSDYRRILAVAMADPDREWQEL